MWPYNEDDFMEIGNTGWICVGEGVYKNIHNDHIIDELGREFDEKGNLIYDPNDNNE